MKKKKNTHKGRQSSHQERTPFECCVPSYVMICFPLSCSYTTDYSMYGNVPSTLIQPHKENHSTRRDDVNTHTNHMKNELRNEDCPDSNNRGICCCSWTEFMAFLGTYFSPSWVGIGN